MNEDRFTIRALKFLKSFFKVKRYKIWYLFPGARRGTGSKQVPIDLTAGYSQKYSWCRIFLFLNPQQPPEQELITRNVSDPRRAVVTGFFEMHKKCHYEGLLIPGHRYLDFPRDRPLTFIVNFEHSSKMDLSHTWPQIDSNSGETIFFILLLFRRRSTRGWRHRNWCTIQTLGTTADTWPAEFFQPAKRAKVWRTPGRSKCSVSRNQNHFSKDNY